MIAPPFLIAALTLLAAPEARAAEATDTSTRAAFSHGKRELPEYDGRAPEGTTAGDVGLWVPRIIFFPLYLVSEYLIRQPLGWLIITAEREQLPTLILDFFTFGEERTAGVFPSALIDFGFRPSVGVYSFINELFAKENQLRLYAAYGGDDWYSVRVSDRVNFDVKNRLAFTFGYVHRPDFRFEGLGPTPPEDLLTRYRTDRVEGLVSFDSIIGDAGHFSAFGSARSVRFSTGKGGCCGNPALEDEIAAGRVEAPPGFGNNYAVWEHGVKIEFDTRRAVPASGDGGRLELFASQALPLSESLPSPWMTYGGSIGGFLDLTDHNRVLSLFVSGELIEPIEHDQVVPFTELVTVGGAGSLPGFKPGTLLGQSRVNGQIEYRWPIWVFVDGTVHAAVGNVFGDRLAGFRWDLLRMSFGLGMRTSGRRDHSFNILFAMGTDTFADGADITTFRFTIGTNRGF